LFDARYVNNARGIYEAICNHIKYATNKGIIRSAITIFRQRTEKEFDFRIWNSQFISYAGYKIDDHTYIGDKVNIEFTQLCINLGWTPKYTDFDVLPLVLQANGQDPEWFELPSEIVMQVEITHPKFAWFRDLKLKWYAVPAVASMLLDVGGIEFPCCPFNGWYMGTEIGRDLADVNRYDKLPIIAEKMGLDIKNNSSLWRDKALVELNYAILTSFQKANVTITDHHSAAESFMKHYENENSLRGGCKLFFSFLIFMYHKYL
jgi:nitric oxide synthase oxygenase domain/subunit